MRVLRILIGGIIATTSVAAATVLARPQMAQIAEGKGDGTLSKSLRKRPADLTQLAKKNQGQFPTEAVAKLIDGRSGDEAHLKADMPIWGDVFSKSQTNTSPEDVKNRIDALVKYLETIQDKGQY